MNISVESDTSILDGCRKLKSEPPAYKTEHYIIEADNKYILKAVAWAKCIESNVYPTMLNMMGHTPTVNLHALHFVNYKLHGNTGPGAWFEKIHRFQNTQYMGSKIKIYNGKLHDQPPYRKEGDITHETIHGLLHEAKHVSRNRTKNWEPIRQGKSHLLEGIFEMELSLRLGNEMKSKERYSKCVQKGAIHAVFAKFWKDYGWEPFQLFIIRLHDDPNFPPMLDKNNFTYYMSVFTKKDVSDFFENCGWDIDTKTKEKITEDLR